MTTEIKRTESFKDFNPIADKFNYDKNGQLSLVPNQIPGLPFGLNYLSNENQLSLIGFDEHYYQAFIVSPYQKYGALAINLVNRYEKKEINQDLGSLFLRLLRRFDHGGKELARGELVTLQKGPQILIIKQRLPGVSLGPDVLRLNFLNDYAENEWVDRTCSGGPGAEFFLEPFLRNNRKLLLVPAEQARVIPGQNALSLNGFMPTRIRESGLPDSMPYKRIENPTIFFSSEDKGEKLLLTALGFTDSGRLSKRFGVFYKGEWIPFPNLLPIEINTRIILQFHGTGCFNDGESWSYSNPQDLAVLEVNKNERGQTILSYLRETDHGEVQGMGIGGIKYNSWGHDFNNSEFDPRTLQVDQSGINQNLEGLVGRLENRAREMGVSTGRINEEQFVGLSEQLPLGRAK